MDVVSTLVTLILIIFYLIVYGFIFGGLIDSLQSNNTNKSILLIILTIIYIFLIPLAPKQHERLFNFYKTNFYNEERKEKKNAEKPITSGLRIKTIR